MDDPNQIVTTYDTYIANPTSLHQIQPSQNGQYLLNHNDVQTLSKIMDTVSLELNALSHGMVELSMPFYTEAKLTSLSIETKVRQRVCVGIFGS